MNTLSFSLILGHWHLTCIRWSWLGRVGRQELFTLTFIFEILSLLSSCWKWHEKVVTWKTRHTAIYLLLSFSLSVSSDSSLSLFPFHRNNKITFILILKVPRPGGAWTNRTHKRYCCSPFCCCWLQNCKNVCLKYCTDFHFLKLVENVICLYSLYSKLQKYLPRKLRKYCVRNIICHFYYQQNWRYLPQKLQK